MMFLMLSLDFTYELLIMDVLNVPKNKQWILINGLQQPNKCWNYFFYYWCSILGFPIKFNHIVAP